MATPGPITVIVPRLSPAVDGLGDYGLLLAGQLRRDFRLGTQFIIGDPDWAGSSEVSRFPVRQVAQQTPAALLDCLPSEVGSTVLLHYVGYGYARRGCPQWLVDGLEQWKQQGPQRHLVTLFHELYADGPIWTSAFWTSGWQRQLAERLARLSDRCVTNRQAAADQLYQLSGRKHEAVPVLPVFSTVGESRYLRPLADRPRWLVVFGSKGPRERVYGESRATLERVCQQLEIEQILDIGPDLDALPDRVGNAPVLALGIRKPKEISNLLATALAGFLAYPANYLGKSTIFAAYCAHGTLPICYTPDSPTADGVLAGKHFWAAAQEPQISLPLAQAIATNGHLWYQAHRLAVHARTFAPYLGVIPSPNGFSLIPGSPIR